jgi:hypothetical protein
MEYFESEWGFCEGKSMHLGSREVGILGFNGVQKRT